MAKQKTEPRLSLEDISNTGFDRQKFREKKVGGKKVFEGTTFTDNFLHVGITYEVERGELSIKNEKNQQLFLGKVTTYEEFAKALQKADESNDNPGDTSKSEEKEVAKAGKIKKSATAKPKAESKKQTPKFKKGDKVAIAVHGAGVVSYEAEKVDRIEKDRVYLKGSEMVFGQDGAEIVPDGMEEFRFGFTNILIPKAEIPSGEISLNEWKNL